MKKPNIKALFVRAFFSAVLLLLVLVSCNQDSIFAEISVEPPRVTALIGGSPTNIVVWNGAIYVASQNATDIHYYKDIVWSSISAPENRKISGLAAPGGSPDYLYALVYNTDMMDASLEYYDGTNWTAVEDGDAADASLQVIYGAGGKLFVGGRSGNTWSIYYVAADDSLKKIFGGSAMLTGAAYDGTDFFLAVSGSIYVLENETPVLAGDGGIYTIKADMTDASLRVKVGPDGDDIGSVKGISNVNGVITAVTVVTNDEGTDTTHIITYDGTRFNTISTSRDYNFTGAMAVWQDPDKPDDRLLLLGVKSGGSYNKGYRELALDEDGKPPLSGNHDSEVKEPGSNLSTVKPDDQSKYDASLARYSVYSLHQVSGSPVIFASTALNGLYVLREGKWNAEESK